MVSLTGDLENSLKVVLEQRTIFGAYHHEESISIRQSTNSERRQKEQHF